MKLFKRMCSNALPPAVFSIEVWDDDKVRVTMRSGGKALVGTMTLAEARQVSAGLAAAADTINGRPR